MSRTIKIRDKIWDLSQTKFMGILNCTPDSFSDGSKFLSTKNALKHTEYLIDSGIFILDIGAQSTRPTAKKISAKEEISRLKEVLIPIKKEFPDLLISIDTFYSEVVDFAFSEGIDLVNDISSGDFDEKMLDTVSKYQLPYVLMHSNTSYNQLHKIEKNNSQSIITEINKYFYNKIQQLLDIGIYNIVCDPGFGFGKSIDQQIYMLENIEAFTFNEYPLLVGISRKSFIYKSLGKTSNSIESETEYLHKELMKKNIALLRVHEVPKF